MLYKKLKKKETFWDYFRWFTIYVGEKRFAKIEKRRIPLFRGSQFGISPQYKSVSGFLNGEKIIAIRAQSGLSGHYAGTFLYKIAPPDYRLQKLDRDGNVIPREDRNVVRNDTVYGVDRHEND